MAEVGFSTRAPAWRRILGTVLAVVAVVLAVLTVLGVWNPWDLVVLWRYFGNPLRGAVVVFVLAFVASWLLAPVQSEAGQARRLRWRIAFALLALASLLGLGLFGPLFSTTYQELARSPDGDRVAVLYDPQTDLQHLHLWVGSGFGTRHVADLGKPCGSAVVEFRGPDLLHVMTSYGQFDLRLDPASGEPLNVLGPTCSG